jgi:hypothetical protein
MQPPLSRLLGNSVGLLSGIGMASVASFSRITRKVGEFCLEIWNFSCRRGIYRLANSHATARCCFLRRRSYLAVVAYSYEHLAVLQ